VRAGVLTPWPHEPQVIHRSNAETIAELGAVEVATLAQVGCDVGQLARAGADLPWRAWLRDDCDRAATAADGPCELTRGRG
jgi:hypothetical protein